MAGESVWIVTWLPLPTSVVGHKRKALSPEHREFDVRRERRNVAATHYRNHSSLTKAGDASRRGGMASSRSNWVPRCGYSSRRASCLGAAFVGAWIASVQRKAERGTD
jgi:hypothetical protein